MKQKTWTRIAAVVLAALLLWWLFWAILADEDAQQIEMQVIYQAVPMNVSEAEPRDIRR